MPRPPAETGTNGEVRAFLRQARNLRRFTQGRARLIFAIDATASRQPTWDLACELQADMFTQSADVGALAVQLAYYRGIGELHFSDWETDTRTLASRMSRVHCAAGRTQIGRLLATVLKRRDDARALVFIGDAVEESTARLEELAGECRLRSLPLFVFQEGRDPQVRAAFEAMARISGGAFSEFDHGSAGRLRELLGAVARYAAGGRAALENQTNPGAQLLLRQLPKR
jgi:hypothetical protein